MNITEQLFSLKDTDYKDFNCRLIPTVSPDTVIGVRTPAVRGLAKQLKGTAEAERFLSVLPHKYFEENNLHGFLIEYIKDYDKCIAAIEKFLPYVDNWATCDCVRPKILKKHPDRLYDNIRVWLESGHTYTVRYAIGLLLSFYLDDSFNPEQLVLVAGIKSEEYYIKMMIAWYFATALAKQYKAALPFITEYRLDKWTHNKTIQKSVESYRLTSEQKEFLKKFRI